MARRFISALVAVPLLLATLVGGAAAQDGQSITFWTAEDNADRVARMQLIVDRFTEQTGIAVELVAIAEDQLQGQVTAAVAGNSLPDVFGAISLGFSHSLAADGITDPAAAAAIVDSLGRDTFSQAALGLVTADGSVVAVPSDSWAQILVYRKDLFEAADLAAPTTLQGVVDAAKALNKDGVAGIVAATGPADSFTQQTFEYFALANGCQVVDEAGAVLLTTQPCVDTFAFYTDLITNGSVPGLQDADTTRAAYFAGQAAMIVWSSFLLDELAALRNDALPVCPECEGDPLFLANNSGVVTALYGAGGEASQFGELVTFAIARDADQEASRTFVEFMMGDGYVDWLALAPEGKVPTRLGTAEEPTKFADAWKGLETGVDTKAALSDIYPPEVLDALATSAETMNRWGFEQGQGRIVGPLLVELPIPEALAAALDGSITPEDAAAQAQADVEDIIASME
jgi:multiple sugar transport system substrate-binding protein